MLSKGCLKLSKGRLKVDLRYKLGKNIKALHKQDLRALSKFKGVIRF